MIFQGIYGAEVAMILMTTTTSLILVTLSRFTSALLHEAAPAMWLMMQTTSLISTVPSELKDA